MIPVPGNGDSRAMKACRLCTVTAIATPRGLATLRSARVTTGRAMVTTGGEDSLSDRASTSMTSSTGNFAPLQSDWPELAQAGGLAETVPADLAATLSEVATIL